MCYSNVVRCEDESSLSYLFVCLDGHGTNGEKVSQVSYR